MSIGTSAPWSRNSTRIHLRTDGPISNVNAKSVWPKLVFSSMISPSSIQTSSTCPQNYLKIQALHAPQHTKLWDSSGPWLTLQGFDPGPSTHLKFIYPSLRGGYFRNQNFRRSCTLRHKQEPSDRCLMLSVYFETTLVSQARLCIVK